MSGQINNFIANAKIISDEVWETFGELSAEQLNWKPNEAEWSIGQCFDHLITTNNLYLANIQPVADGTHKNNFYSKIPFLAGLIGKILKKAFSPDSAKKIKTFPVFKPLQSGVSETIIREFGRNQERLISMLEAVKDIDIRKIKIAEPLSPALNVHLTDAFEILVLHEKRHFIQAERVLEMEGFPQ